MDSFRERVNRAPAQPPPLIAPTFQEFYDRYFPLIVEGLSSSTAKDYRLVAERCLLERFGSWRLSDITAGAVNLWIRELKLERRAAGKRPLAGATINGYANILRALVNYAVRFDVLEKSPFKKRLEREKVNRPKNELSDRECAAFLAAFDDRDAFVADLRGKYRRGEVVPCERYPHRACSAAAAAGTAKPQTTSGSTFTHSNRSSSSRSPPASVSAISVA